jgi:hypothetical protein
MNLQARKTNAPFVCLAISLVIVTLACFWSFFKAATFDWSAFLNLILICGLFLGLWGGVYLGIRRAQSVELNDEGISAELLEFSINMRHFPRFKRVFLRWDETRDVRIRGNAIRVRGAAGSIVINTFYFPTVDLVLKLIERHVGERM